MDQGKTLLTDAFAVGIAFLLVELALKPRDDQLSWDDLAKVVILIVGVKYVADFSAQWITKHFYP